MQTVKVWLISDLHLEHYHHDIDALWTDLKKKVPQTIAPGRKPENEVLVLAGDLGWPVLLNGTVNPGYRQLLKNVKESFETVIFVSGNHEMYGKNQLSLDAVDQVLRDLARETDTHYLQKDSLLVRGLLFLGCTLWTRVKERDFFGLNDSRFVFKEHSDYLALHMDHRRWLEEELIAAKNKGQRTVVVTHHLPSAALVHPRFAMQPNSGFCTNLEALIASKADVLKLWVSGHSHERMTANVAGVPLVINPVGYKEEVRVTQTVDRPVEISLGCEAAVVTG